MCMYVYIYICMSYGQSIYLVSPEGIDLVRTLEGATGPMSTPITALRFIILTVTHMVSVLGIIIIILGICYVLFLDFIRLIGASSLSDPRDPIESPFHASRFR